MFYPFIIEQRMYPKWKRGYIVGEMSEANFLHKILPKSKKKSKFNHNGKNILLLTSTTTIIKIQRLPRVNVGYQKNKQKGESMRGKLRNIRKEQKLTQENLSKMVNIHRTHYSMIENGRRNPSLKVAVSIKKALNYQYDDIFEKQ